MGRIIAAQRGEQARLYARPVRGGAAASVADAVVLCVLSPVAQRSYSAGRGLSAVCGPVRCMWSPRSWFS